MTIRRKQEIMRIVLLTITGALLAGCGATGTRSITLGDVTGDLKITMRSVGSHNQGRPSQGMILNASGELPLEAIGIPGVGTIPLGLGINTPPAVADKSGISVKHVGGKAELLLEIVGSGNQLFDSVEGAAQPDYSSNANVGGYEAKWEPPDDGAEAVDESATESHP